MKKNEKKKKKLEEKEGNVRDPRTWKRDTRRTARSAAELIVQKQKKEEEKCGVHVHVRGERGNLGSLARSEWPQNWFFPMQYVNLDSTYMWKVMEERR
jgi:hypothetical protein